jgi:hypothetical protein
MTTQSGKTKREIKQNLWGSNVVIPKGTDVIYIKEGNRGWAVSSAHLLVELTGNWHDPYCRYAWIEAEDVICSSAGAST